MRNIIRFLIGLLVFLVLLLTGIIALALLSPAIIGASLLFALVGAIAAIIFAIALFFAFIWFMSRKEPDEGKSRNYSIKQGEEIK
ncbi:hypothetical protein GF345_04900 [Candidatus Woesearchaeota archaeon]|nr:hypothetical protein [Candidatus Woesearchaeota archaeon]